MVNFRAGVFQLKPLRTARRVQRDIHVVSHKDTLPMFMLG